MVDVLIHFQGYLQQSKKEEKVEQLQSKVNLNKWIGEGESHFISMKKSLVDGWMAGWMGGCWMGVNPVFRFASSKQNLNKKIKNYHIF